MLWRTYHPAAFQWPLLEPTLASVLSDVRGETSTVFLGNFRTLAEQRAPLSQAACPFVAG